MIDLHTHSTASDGTDSPLALLELAASAGLTAFAITDHDTLAGSDQAAAAESSVELVRGLELSTRILEETNPASRSVHLLGYFFREPASDFRVWLDSLRHSRRKRNREMVERLNAQGIDVAIEEVEGLGQNITGRPHIAWLMKEKGYVKSWDEAFRVYLGEHGSAYVEREDPPIREGIDRIRAAGGVPSLAHPGRLCKPDAAGEEALIARLAGWGLEGIEAWHPDHDAPAAARYCSLAARYGLVVTGGSDHHGYNKQLAGLGRWNGEPIPTDLLDGLRRRALDKQASA